jgi:large subunit ribosomal protein L29
VKPSEIRDKTDDELRALETELRDKLVQLKVAQVTRRTATNTAQFGRIRKDIARVKTILAERGHGIATEAVAAEGGSTP